MISWDIRFLVFSQIFIYQYKTKIISMVELRGHLEKKVSELEDRIEELNNRMKLADIDLEKRVLVLEDNFKQIEKFAKSLKEAGEIGKLLDSLKDLEEKLRDIEDKELINKMEVVGAVEAVEDMRGMVDTLREKVDLISRSLENLAELKGAHADIDFKKILKVSHAIKEFSKRLETLELNALKKEEMNTLLKDVKKLRKDIEKTIKENTKKMSELLKVTRNEIELLSRNIGRIEKELDGLKSSVKKFDEKKVKKLEKKVERIENKALKELLNDLELVLKRHELLAGKTKNELKELKKELASLKKDVIAGSGKKGAREQIQKEIKSEIESRFKEIVDEIRKTEKEWKERMKQLEGMHGGDAVLYQSEEIKKFQERFAFLEKELKRLSVLDELKKQMREFESRVNELESKLKQEIEKSSKTDLERKILPVVEELDSVVKALKKRQEELDNLMSQKIKSEVERETSEMKMALKKLEEVQITHEELFRETRKNFETVKMLRDEIIDDVNAIVSEAIRNAIDEHIKSESFQKYLAQRLDRLEMDTSRKINLILERVEQDVDKKIEQLEELGSRLDGRLRTDEMSLEELVDMVKVLRKENVLLAAEVKKLKEYLEKLVGIEMNAPLVID